MPCVDSPFVPPQFDSSPFSSSYLLFFFFAFSDSRVICNKAQNMVPSGWQQGLGLDKRARKCITQLIISTRTKHSGWQRLQKQASDLNTTRMILRLLFFRPKHSEVIQKKHRAGLEARVVNASSQMKERYHRTIILVEA